MFKFFKMAFIVSLSTALLLIAPTTQAAIVSYDFNGTVDSGMLDGETYNGSFTYDDVALTNTGLEFINLSSLTFDFSSTIFTLANADLTPSADFFDGLFLGLSYTVDSFDPGFSLVSGYSDSSEAYFAFTPVLGDSGFGSLNFANVTVVPVPAAVWLFGSGLGLLTIGRRRKNQNHA